MSDKVPDTVPVYDLQEPPAGRNGMLHYSDVMAKLQEEQNAAREGRAPNYSKNHLKSVSHPGRVPVTAEQLVSAHRSSANAAFIGEIKAAELGKIPNPVKVEAEAREREAEANRLRAEAITEPTVEEISATEIANDPFKE